MNSKTSFQEELSRQIDRFSKEHIWPFASEDDQLERFRIEVFKGLGELGIAGMTIPEEYQGLGLSYSDFCQALLEISKASISYAVTLSVSAMAQSIILEYGNEEQKQKYLPELALGKEIGAFALTESNAGSDASSLKLKATSVQSGYELQGNKIFITSAGIAKTYIVMARTGEEGAKGISAFIVDAQTPGLSVGKKEKKMGWRASPTCELIFNKCFVPKENLLGKEGQGLKIALSGLDRGRITIAAMACGLSIEAFKRALTYAQERTQFGQNIANFQGIEFLLADLALDIENSQLLMQKAAGLCDRLRSQTTKISDQERKELTLCASMAKLKATDVAMKVTTEAVQILGGVGYTSDYPLERMMRDAKVMQILEGTNQIQRLVIARSIKEQFPF